MHLPEGLQDMKRTYYLTLKDKTSTSTAESGISSHPIEDVQSTV